uniref:Ig-like domain-containing protein n=1 Tax=Sinocyclocheilus grahami TaxID=75366 RepID=A0A672Q532_SINGR
MKKIINNLIYDTVCGVDCLFHIFPALHTFITTYTGISGKTIAGIPEFFAVTTLDGQQIDYYDSETESLVPRQEWMKEYASKELWKEDTEIREQVQQTYKNNIAVLMQRFNQTGGVHVYQRMYGCGWADETGESYGFDQYGYDGEDYVTLDVKKGRYTAATPQAMESTAKWNNDSSQLEFLQQHYEYECVYWLRFFINSRKAPLESKGTPEVSLLQSSSSPVVQCHATGFYPSAMTITWLRNGQEHDEDVDLGETLINEDGTFQRTSTLNIDPDDWKKHRYVCVVEHKGKTIQKVLTEDEIKNNKSKLIIVWYSLEAKKKKKKIFILALLQFQFYEFYLMMITNNLFFLILIIYFISYLF